ncbi:MAG: MotA/TolQ/ExbB proton channel family protein [Bacteriovoracaceae bacterium]|nr:MotA/TolQ/ExbB proton channel family protein [Bacteriovoracaceae bacterium]
MMFLINFFQAGGFWMWPILGMFILGSIVIAERVYYIMFKYDADGAKLFQQVQKCIIDNNIDDALKLCNSNKNAPIYLVFKAALMNADRPFDEIQDQVEVANLEVIPKLQMRVSFLYTIANVATLIGLLGTIIGLVATFEAVGSVEASQKQVLLSLGISTAMNTTAFGLIVAIPCMLTYGYLFNKINMIVDEVDHFSARLLVLLRTGSGYFENFSSKNVVSTQQQPKINEKSENKIEDKKNAA